MAREHGTGRRRGPRRPGRQHDSVVESRAGDAATDELEVVLSVDAGHPYGEDDAADPLVDEASQDEGDAGAGDADDEAPPASSRVTRPGRRSPHTGAIPVVPVGPDGRSWTRTDRGDDAAQEVPAADADESDNGPGHPFLPLDHVIAGPDHPRRRRGGRRHHAPTRRRPVGLIITVALLSVLTLGASAFAAYLWHVSEEWRVQVEDITDVSYGLGADLAAEREALVTAQERIDLLSEQLATSKDTVSRLQAENAQWGDDAAFAQEQFALLQQDLAAAQTVSTSLKRCIEAHDQLLEYLDQPEDLEEGEVESFRTSVNDLCTQALRAQSALAPSSVPATTP
ncbi:hypothetical protein [Demequina pelophila]|uniref:hypothetical protein n=1 Tax=Demequina pelophila TaxID=1638984 RepID=UPI000784C513|nr:hypothetical protein [Demequina pelophila]